MNANVERIKYAVKNRTSLPPDQVDETSLMAAGCQSRVFLLPKKLDERMSYMANVLVQMFGIGSPVKDDLKFVSSVLCQTLSYLVNSQSWRDGELHDFDLDEIKRKVGLLVRK